METTPSYVHVFDDIKVSFLFYFLCTLLSFAETSYWGLTIDNEKNHRPK